MPRAVRQFGPRALAKARSVLPRIRIIRLDYDLLDAVANLDPMVLRALDAIHLATAHATGMCQSPARMATCELGVAGASDRTPA